MIYALQRHILGHDCNKWRTVLRLSTEKKALAAMAIVTQLALLSEPMEFRVVDADKSAPPYAIWTHSKGWIT